MVFLRELAVLAAFLAAAVALRQEFRVYEAASSTEQGNSHIFQRNTPNLPISFSNMKRFCANGKFLTYNKPNYESFRGEPGGTNACYPSSPAEIQSFRYPGASESTQDAVSLYTGENFEGQEILVAQSAFGFIEPTIRSLGWTGKSAWTLFEGLNFNGRSACIPVPQTITYIEVRTAIKYLNITTVGSLFKGCPAILTTEYVKSVRAEWQARQINLQ